MQILHISKLITGEYNLHAFSKTIYLRLFLHQRALPSKIIVSGPAVFLYLVFIHDRREMLRQQYPH